MSVYVTIGVCAKNAEKTIRECIVSIINQRYPAKLMRIVFVDGYSSDKTIPIVASAVSKTDIRVEICSDKGKGLGAARQIAVDHANGKYIIFVDADVKLFDDFVTKHVRFMEENPTFGVAFGRIMHQEGTLVSTVWDLYICTAGGFVGSGATIFRSEALAQAGGFDTSIIGAAEDVDLITRIQAKGWLIAINKEARLFHKFRETLKDFWSEQSWFGYGGHYRSHKSGNRRIIANRLLAGSFICGTKIAMKAYDSTGRKLSFLIPFQAAFGDIAWWSGFIKGHLDGYGHQKN